MSMMLAYLNRYRRHKGNGVTIVYTDPLHAGRHPFQTFMNALALVAGMTLILTEVKPGTLEATLPLYMVYGWYGALVVGATLALVGAYWRGSYDTSLTLERIGLDLSGIAAVIYSACVLVVAGRPGLYAAAITVGFGSACLVRARDIGLVFGLARQRLEEGAYEDDDGCEG